jgi:hypothetical protein
MSDKVTIKTNNVPRFTIDAWELTPDERKEFDYLNWSAIEDGSDSATFFRYKGQLYDLGEFMHTRGLPEFSPLVKWDGYLSDSFFSGILVRYCEDHESVIVATFYA